MYYQSRLFYQISQQLAGAMADYAADVIVPEIQGHLSTAYPPASTSGEDGPHARKGRLRDGVGAQTVVSGSQVSTIVYSNRVPGDPRVPGFLERGTATMLKRPYMTPAYERMMARGVMPIVQRM